MLPGSRRRYTSFSAKCWKLSLPLMTRLSFPNTFMGCFSNFSATKFSMWEAGTCLYLHILPDSSLCFTLMGQKQLSRHPPGEWAAYFQLLLPWCQSLDESSSPLESLSSLHGTGRENAPALSTRPTTLFPRWLSSISWITSYLGCKPELWWGLGVTKAILTSFVKYSLAMSTALFQNTR